MLKEERQDAIIELLNNEQKVLASELSNLFKVSEDTIRRDLKELDNRGLLRRVHSGALRIGPPITDFSYRQNIYNEEKEKIAKKALPFLKQNSVILIDGSTTNLALVKLIPIDFKATIITNSPPISMALSQHKEIEVINIGGILYKQSMVNLGIMTYQQIKNIRADLFIMGIYNIDDEAGTSVPTIQEAEIKREMSDVSTEILSMITSDKFGTISNNIVGSIGDLNYLITDYVTPQIRKKYAKGKLTLID